MAPNDTFVIRLCEGDVGRVSRSCERDRKCPKRFQINLVFLFDQNLFCPYFYYVLFFNGRLYLSVGVSQCVGKELAKSGLILVIQSRSSAILCRSKSDVPTPL